MSELTWYSRLLVWVGAVILVVESASGRTLGLVTVVGVMALAAGLLSFTAGLAFDGMPAGSRTAVAGDQPESMPDLSEQPPPPRVEQVEPDVPVVKPVTEEPAPPKRETVERRGATGTDVTAASGLAGSVCLACHEPLREAQVAAVCHECQTAHHAACWVGNRFHCARDGCGGHGPLEAPEGSEERAGPSTA